VNSGFGPETIQTTLWPTSRPAQRHGRPRLPKSRNRRWRAASLRGEVKLASTRRFPSSPDNQGEDLATITSSVLGAFAQCNRRSQVSSRSWRVAGPKTSAPLGELYLPATAWSIHAWKKDRPDQGTGQSRKDLEQPAQARSTPTCSPRHRASQG